MRQNSNIPINLIKEACKSGKTEHLRLFILMKNTGKRFFRWREIRELANNNNFNKRKIKNLIQDIEKLGLIRTNKYTIHMKSWKNIVRNIVGGATSVKFNVEWCDKKQFKARLFWIATAYMMKPHNAKDTLKWHKKITKQQRKGIRVLEPSEHNGGISLSLMASFFDKTKSWASRMRKDCERLGLLVYRRRFTEAPENARYVQTYDWSDDTGKYVYRKGKLMEEITSKCFVIISPKLKPFF